MDVGQVPGPMLDYTRYYPTTLPMHQPRHDSSEASAASDEVRVVQRVPSLGTPSPTWLVRCLSKEFSFVHTMALEPAQQHLCFPQICSVNVVIDHIGLCPKCWCPELHRVRATGICLRSACSHALLGCAG